MTIKDYDWPDWEKDVSDSELLQANLKDLEDAVSKRTGQEMDKATLDSKIQELELEKIEIVRAHEEIVAKNEDDMKVAVKQLKGSIVSVKKTVDEKDKTIGNMRLTQSGSRLNLK